MTSWKSFGTALLVGICILSSYTFSFSQLTPANHDAVIAVANNWLHLGQEMGWAWTATLDFTPSSIQEIEYQGELVAFNLPTDEGGHIIIPAYHELPPITAYSTDSYFNVMDEGGFCEMIKQVLSYKIHLLQNYMTDPNPPPEQAFLQEAIDQYRTSWGTYSSDYQTFTNAVEKGNRGARMDSEDQMEGRYGILSVGPLMSSTWHQDAPYNDFCPMGDPCRCVVGCVATAMGQTMKYWEYPENGIGSHSYWWNGDGSVPGQWLSATFSDAYDWDNIKNSHSTGDPQVEKDAVAELCYEAGVSVDMMYGCGSSAAYHSDLIDAYEDYFGYTPGIERKFRRNYTASSWFAMLQNELNLMRPLHYGVESHSINCDGWRVSGTNQIHMNYGWGGSYNGWYTIDALFLGGYWVEEAFRYIIGAPFMHMTYPNGGQTWCTGVERTITWGGAGFTGGVTISLNRNYPAGGWETLFSGTSNDGEQSWVVTGPATSNARIRIISDSAPTIGDTSDSDFMISDPYIHVTTPNGGNNWYVDNSYTIYWASCGITGNVDIALNRDYPTGGWETLFSNTADDGYEEWTVIEPTTSDARIRVTSVSSPSILDISDSDFTISNRYIEVTAPNGGESWYVDDYENITWTSLNISGTVTITINYSYPYGAWQNIVQNTDNDGVHNWQVSLPTTNNARIRVISDSYPSEGDTSNADFTITEGSGIITVLTPNGGETWYIDSTKNITWSSSGITGNVKIELDRNYPSSWETLFSSITDDGTQPWTVTGPVTDDARVQISSISYPSISDISDADFSIDDDMAPVIWHDPRDDDMPGYIVFVAGVTDELIPTVRLFWRVLGGGLYDSTDMTSTPNPDEYSATLNLPDIGSYDYYIKAVDADQQVSTTDVYDFQLYRFCGTEMCYDDGSAERHNWAGDPRFRWAVKFTPSSTPFILCGARFAVSRIKPDSAHQRVRIEVYDNDGPSGFPGTLLFSDTTGSVGNVEGGLLPGQIAYWADAHIRDGSEEPLVLNDDFYIAVSNPDSGSYEAFSRDTTGTIADRSYLYDDCEGQWYAENDVWENCKDGNRMIQAIGYSEGPPTVVVSRSGDDAVLYWTRTGAPHYRIYSDTSDPFGSYSTLEGSTTDTTFLDVDAISDETKKFYRVVSSTQP